VQEFVDKMNKERGQLLAAEKQFNDLKSEGLLSEADTSYQLQVI
jgi:hypothetical protein